MQYKHDERKIIAWHGSQKWDGKAQIKASPAERQEHGPGIYFTNNMETAKKYSRGAGKVMVFEIEKPRLLELSHTVPFTEAQKFINSLYRAKNKDKTLRELEEQIKDNGELSIVSIMNISCMNGTTIGKHSIELAEWIVEKGFDARIHTASNKDEQWLILFNPSLVKKAYRHEKEHDDFQMAKFSDQIQAINYQDDIKEALQNKKTYKPY